MLSIWTSPKFCHSVKSSKTLEKTALKKKKKKNCGKRQKCRKRAFSPFPIMFSDLPRHNSNIYVMITLKSSNAFILNKYNFCMSDKE